MLWGTLDPKVCQGVGEGGAEPRRTAHPGSSRGCPGRGESPRYGRKLKGKKCFRDAAGSAPSPRLSGRNGGRRAKPALRKNTVRDGSQRSEKRRSRTDGCALHVWRGCGLSGTKVVCGARFRRKEPRLSAVDGVRTRNGGHFGVCVASSPSCRLTQSKGVVIFVSRKTSIPHRFTHCYRRNGSFPEKATTALRRRIRRRP